jgi:hypothetical protein
VAPKTFASRVEQELKAQIKKPKTDEERYNQREH